MSQDHWIYWEGKLAKINYERGRKFISAHLGTHPVEKEDTLWLGTRGVPHEKWTRG
jgi:hypothetical protein